MATINASGNTSGALQSKKYQIEFDEGRHPRGKVGFVLLATEQTIPDDMFQIFPEGVGIHFARVNNPDVIDNQTLAAIAPDLSIAAKSLLPDGSLDVVTYGCTSGSLVLGEDRVHDLLNRGAPKAKASCIIAAVIRALKAVDAQKIVVATPYLDEVNRAEYDYLSQRGFDVLDIQGLNLVRDSDMVKVSPTFILNMAAEIDRPDADAIFISCGALRSVDIIEELEQRCGKPVITSNQAMAWDALRLAGIKDNIAGYGKLFSDSKISHHYA
ncbi:MAG: arylmalonate decarboxylase [Gammaproteobacteria bacterium]|nr:arylmalonate decarboxylase [Gammaproteobacteria bacterium]